MAKRSVTKPRGYPIAEAWGAQSDFIAEQFGPTEEYRAQQMAMAQKLIEAGMNPEQLETLFLFPVDQLSVEKPQDDNPKGQ